MVVVDRITAVAGVVVRRGASVVVVGTVVVAAAPLPPLPPLPPLLPQADRQSKQAPTKVRPQAEAHEDVVVCLVLHLFSFGPTATSLLVRALRGCTPRPWLGLRGRARQPTPPDQQDRPDRSPSQWVGPDPVRHLVLVRRRARRQWRAATPTPRRPGPTSGTRRRPRFRAAATRRPTSNFRRRPGGATTDAEPSGVSSNGRVPLPASRLVGLDGHRLTRQGARVERHVPRSCELVTTTVIVCACQA